MQCSVPKKSCGVSRLAGRHSAHGGGGPTFCSISPVPSHHPGTDRVRDPTIDRPGVDRILVGRGPADPADDQRASRRMGQRPQRKLIPLHRPADQAALLRPDAELHQLRQQARHLMPALEHVAVERPAAEVVLPLLGEEPGHAVDPDDAAAQVAEAVGVLKEVGVAERDYDAAREPGDARQVLHRRFDRLAADGVEPPARCVAGLRGGDQPNAQPEAPPQPQRVPALGVGPADVARIADEKHGGEGRERMKDEG